MIKNIKLDATVDNWPVVFNFLDKHLTDAGVSAEQKTIIETAAEEIYVNIAHYAYGKGNGKAKIELDVSEAPFSVKLVFKDKGIPYKK